MRIQGFLVLLVLSLTEVAWTAEWSPGKPVKLAPEDEYQLIWGEQQQQPEKTDFKTGFYKPNREEADFRYRQPASEFPEYQPAEKPMRNQRERYLY